MKRKFLTLAATGATAVAAYRLLVKPWHERWGATDAELDLDLPGDDLVAEPAHQITRAITIDAPPEQVWPWIVQIGADRGGFYSYDWLENLFGLGIHSADSVVDDWQGLQPGDIVAADRSGTGGWVVSELRPSEALALQVADVGTGEALRRDQGWRWEFLWTFALRPAPGGGSRFLVRERMAFGSALTGFAMAPVGFVSFVMTRRMMLGIRSRSERGPRGPLQ